MGKLQASYIERPTLIAFNRGIERWGGGNARIEAAILTANVVTIRTTVYLQDGQTLTERADKVLTPQFEQDGTPLGIEERSATASSDGAHLMHKLIVNPDGGPLSVKFWNEQSGVSTAFELDLHRDLLSQ